MGQGSKVAKLRGGKQRFGPHTIFPECQKHPNSHKEKQKYCKPSQIKRSLCF
jgi:hypothetical protein